MVISPYLVDFDVHIGMSRPARGHREEACRAKTHRSRNARKRQAADRLADRLDAALAHQRKLNAAGRTS